MRSTLLLGFAALTCAADAQEPLGVHPNQPVSVPPQTYTPPPFTESTDPTPDRRPSPAGSPFVRDAAVTAASFESIAPPDPVFASPSTRTPIGRGGVGADSDGERPSAAATLRRGMWSSGTAVVLIAVLGGALVWTIRRRNPQLAASLPREAVDLLGRQRLDAKNAVGLLRVGKRLLIVGIGEDGLRTLGEVSDEAEVDRLAGLCRPAGQGGGFAAMLQSAVPTPKARPDANSAPRPEMADLPGRRGERPTRLDLTTP